MWGPILVTGFEPFGDWADNPSARLVQVLARQLPTQVQALVLPTSFERVGAPLRSAIRRGNPRAILLFGLSSLAEVPTLELMAQNLDHSHGVDNDGVSRQAQSILPEAPVAYRSTLPLEAMVELAASLGQSVTLSRDCGGFLCNHAFFLAAHEVVISGLASPVGFVHLPLWDRAHERWALTVEVASGWVGLLAAGAIGQSSSA